MISEDDVSVQMEIKLGDADRRAAPPPEIEVDDLFESDDILSASETKSLLHDTFVGVWRLIRFTLMVSLPILSAVVGWYAGRDDLKTLTCAVIVSPECAPVKLQATTPQVIEPRGFNPPAQRYALPKFLGDDSPAKLPVPTKAQRQTKPVR